MIPRILDRDGSVGIKYLRVMVDTKFRIKGHLDYVREKIGNPNSSFTRMIFIIISGKRSAEFHFLYAEGRISSE